MPKIVHFHYNTSSNVNIGDEAHVLAIQDALHVQIGDLEIVNFPISFLCHYQVPEFVPAARRLPLLVHNAARVLRGTSYDTLIRTINQSDMVVIGGGGVYMDHLLPFNIRLLEKITVPVVVFGAGYNHNFGEREFDPNQLKSIVRLGQLARLQSVRDKHTLDFLVKNNVNATLVGDPAVFLQAKAKSATKKSAKHIHIAINIAAHDWKLQPEYEELLLEAYAFMMNDLQRRLPVLFHYFVHHPGELNVIDALAKKGTVFTSVVNSDARKTKSMYGTMDLTVSMMLHSTILAFGEGVPAVCVGYDSKNKSFMDLTGQSNRYISVQEISPRLLTQKVEELITTRKASAADIRKELARQRTHYDTFARRVASLLH